jgi:hypothetical protein
MIKEQFDHDVACLTSCPANDVNFQGALERADREAINAALKYLEGRSGVQTKELALRRRLRKLGRTGSDVDTTTALTLIDEEKAVEETAQVLQNDRERDIAHAHETAGVLKALNFVGKVVTVTSLVQLDTVKKTKGYRGIGTWDEFCNYVGLDRHSIDQQLLSLHTFGEDFLVTVTNFGIGYRDLRKLRKLADEGSITVTGTTIEIAGELIPLDPAHKDDLQEAIERVLDEKADALEDALATVTAKDRVLHSKDAVITKQEKELRKLSREAEARGLLPTEDAFLQRMENLHIGFDGYMQKADPDFVMNEFSGQGEITPRMRAALISNLAYMRMQILAAYDCAVTNYGDPSMNPELLDDFNKWNAAQT